MASKFPDSDDESIKVDELPRAVKYYRCDGHTETGVPCNDYKFHTGHVCDKVTVKVKFLGIMDGKIICSREK